MPLTAFQRLAIAATVVTYLLIAVGGLVRASGAGLGCPDWPRCFGTWVPPTSAAELPPQFDASQFNPTLMWTEYVNRLLGVTVGLVILAAAVSAWRTHRRQPRVLWPTIGAVLLTAFEGWLGGRVVAHELEAWIVTAHMLIALVIVSLLLVATLESLTAAAPGAISASRRTLGWAAIGAIALALIQVGLGTQVRGRVDDALAVLPRPEALAAVGTFDTIHRGVAAVTALVIFGLWAAVVFREAADRRLRRAATGALVCTAAQLGLGVVLTAGLPQAAQVLHLTVSSLLLGALTTTAFVALRWPAPFVDTAHAAR